MNRRNQMMKIMNTKQQYIINKKNLVTSFMHIAIIMEKKTSTNSTNKSNDESQYNTLFRMSLQDKTNI